MKKRILFILFIGMSFGINAQTLTEKQRQNARATGYSIIASRNPNVDFSVLMIPWDGVNTLEYNANTQINPSWHPQAVIKGNFYSQSFDGSDFSKYSTVLLSQERFDQFKNTGTQWWIVCSTLPSFSEKTNFKGNVGIGTTTPFAKLDLKGDFKLGNGSTYTDLILKTGTGINGYNGVFEIEPITKPGSGTAQQMTYFKNASHSNGKTVHNVMIDGKLGIGTTNTKGFKLGVNGKIAAEEVKVALYGNWSDFVFKKEYNLPTLTEVENHIKEKGHLKDIPSAKEVEKNGFYLGEMDAKLLQKIEELTLYTISQEKKIEKVEKENESLKFLATKFLELQKRLEKLEKE